MAFVPIEVLFVTLIIHRVLSEREKRNRLEKLNMVIGAFFSDVGTKLLILLSDADPTLDQIRKELLVSGEWAENDFSDVSQRLRGHDYSVNIQKTDLRALRTFLAEKMDFLLRLLENPNLLEHETFTELLRAVFHLAEELCFREDVTRLPDSDRQHIAGDIKRAYGQLVFQWLDYMRYLKDNYPYLFSLALRTNPFDKAASPIVR
jgi:hypothetical protein